MTSFTTDQSLPTPDLGDLADGPGAFSALVAAVESRLVRRYASAADRSARNPSPIPGSISWLEDVGRHEFANTAGTWINFDRGVVGGTRYTGTGNLSAGITTIETDVNMTTGALSLQAGRLYRIHVKVKWQGSVTNDEHLFRVRDTNLLGTQRAEFTTRNLDQNLGWETYLEADYETSVAETKTWIVTAVRLAGTGTLAVVGGGTINATYIVVEDAGPAGLVTTQSTP
jgi:hypothetical protein